MSKSLGNSPDPLDLIAKYGADGLRFGLMRIAPSGQDIRFDEKQIEEGRNFANKLWNATRFRQMHGGETEGEINPALLTSDDKWILLRLDARHPRGHTGARRTTISAKRPRRFIDFSGANIAIGIWRRAKPRSFGRGETRRKGEHARRRSISSSATLCVCFILSCLSSPRSSGTGSDSTPICLTIRGRRRSSSRAGRSRWRTISKRHYGLTPNDEATANAKYETVTAGRRLRRDFNIASNKRVAFVLVPSSPLPEEEAAVLRILLNAERLDLPARYEPPKGRQLPSRRSANFTCRSKV